eukprot:11414925-Ditylum_brightwellii.AAC.1
MYKMGTFHCQIKGKLAIILLEENLEISEPMIFTNKCPQDVLGKYKTYAVEGKVYDANVGLYTIVQREKQEVAFSVDALST